MYTIRKPFYFPFQNRLDIRYVIPLLKYGISERVEFNAPPDTI